jgi:hypothetical protein
VLHSVVPLEQTAALGYVDAEESARLLAESGIRLPAASGPNREETRTRPIQLVGA